MKQLSKQVILCLLTLTVIVFSWQFVTTLRLRVGELGNLAHAPMAAQPVSEQPEQQAVALAPLRMMITATVTPMPSMPTLGLPAATATYQVILIPTATPLPLTQIPSAWLTLTPSVIFAAATAAKAATLEAQRSQPITATLATGDDQATAPALEQTATAEYAAAATTVAAVMTSVNQPGWQVFTLTPTPTPIMVTATPTPVDAFAAATGMAQMTAEAATTGTATPLPTNWFVVTPILVIETPKPANQATAIQQNALATAQAITTGTPDPYQYKLAITFVTATPTPTSLVALAQWVVAATQQALAVGTATPTPINWVVVTPAVVTNTATPGNPATAQAQGTLGWAIAMLTGTPLPHSIIATATPTPALRPVEDPTLLTDLSTPRAPHPPFPQELVGKILFVTKLIHKEDKLSHKEVDRKDHIFAINPDGSELAELTDRWAYDIAEERDAFTANKSDRAYALFDKTSRQVQLFDENFTYNTIKSLTAFGAGTAWAPAWSPTSDQIVFVANESRNDELWIVEKGKWPALQVTHNQWEWDHHPSWAPDGNTIVFSSNRNDGFQQLWVMDANGGNQRQLTNFGFEVWDPVWVKYADPYIQMRVSPDNRERPQCQICVPIQQP